MNGLTQETLKGILHYQPDTGAFTRLTACRGRSVGSIAGTCKNDGRVHIKVLQINYLAARLAYLYVTGKFPNAYVHHKNGDLSDIKWSNLESSYNKVQFKRTDLHKEVAKKRALVLKQKDLGKVPDKIIWLRLKDKVNKLGYNLTVSMVSRYRLDAGLQSSSPQNTNRAPHKVNEVSQWLLKWGVP